MNSLPFHKIKLTQEQLRFRKSELQRSWVQGTGRPCDISSFCSVMKVRRAEENPRVKFSVIKVNLWRLVLNCPRADWEMEEGSFALL